MAVKRKTVKLPEWCDSAESITAEWMSACETSNRYFKIFPPLKLSDRLKRLLAVAFCYDIWPLLKDERSRNAVLVAERFADGQATEAQRQDAYAYAAAVTHAAYDAATHAYTHAAAAAADTASYATYYASYASAAIYYASYASADLKAKWMYHGRLLCSVIGPGWQFDTLWRTDTAVVMARQMYESRDFSAMPILADAIQDAGCCEEVLLDAMRSPDSAWCRGCRIVDELLGRR